METQMSAPMIAHSPATARAAEIPLPDYLDKLYWWIYVRPWAPFIWDHQWTVNAILLGNYNRMRDLAIGEFTGHCSSGKTLQIGAAYGNLTPRLASHIAHHGGTLDVVDVVPNQIKNLKRKLSSAAPVRTFVMDAARLEFPAASYDTVLIFMLLHEESQEYRERTLTEALRVVKPGGKLVIMDYGSPKWWHPARFITLPVYRRIKPPAREVWDNGVGLEKVLSAQMRGHAWQKTSYFGNLFQKLVTVAT